MGLEYFYDTYLANDDPLKVLELGTGCGIVGLTLAACFENANVTITDLPQAEDIANHNITTNEEINLLREGQVTYENLDWSRPHDAYMQEKNFDLVIAADVTYNCDSIPDLVKTVATALRVGKQHAVFLVAMKVRHPSEAVFFTEMQKHDMIELESKTLPLPVLGEDDQEIKVYLFGPVTHSPEP